MFYPPAWNQCYKMYYRDTRLFGLPFEIDVRVLYINRGALAAHGYSPNAVPKSWSQSASMASALDQKTGSEYSAITFYPEMSGSIALDTLNWLNGGAWQHKMTPTANSRQNVATGEWIKGWVDRYGGLAGYQALEAHSQPGLDMFSSGLQAMHIDQPSYQALTLVQREVNFGDPSSANSKIANIHPPWNVALLPIGDSGTQPYSYSGGIAISLPRSDTRSSGATAAAWEFTKFMSLVGQLTFERHAGNIPTVMHMWHDTHLKAKPHWSKFIAAMRYARAGTLNSVVMADSCGGETTNFCREPMPVATEWQRSRQMTHQKDIAQA